MTTLVRGARQLLTLRGDSGPRRGARLRDLGIVPNGAVLIKDGAIVDAGPARSIQKLPEARRAREIDATGRVVMPGFVASHTHLGFGGPGPGAASKGCGKPAGRAGSMPRDAWSCRDSWIATRTWSSAGRAWSITRCDSQAPATRKLRLRAAAFFRAS